MSNHKYYHGVEETKARYFNSRRGLLSKSLELITTLITGYFAILFLLLSAIIVMKIVSIVHFDAQILVNIMLQWLEYLIILGIKIAKIALTPCKIVIDTL